jgi:hypothetical protein
MVGQSENIPVCYTHRDRRSITVCTKCGAFLCPDCVSKSASPGDELICPVCRTRSPERKNVPPPWENRHGAGYIRTFFETWRAVVFNSRAFFYSLPPAGPVFKPVLYAAICMAIGLIGAIPAALQSVTALSALLASIAEVIPIIGGLLALLLRLFFYGRGVPAIHNLSPVRAFSFYITLTGITLGLIYLLFRFATNVLPPSLIS